MELKLNVEKKTFRTDKGEDRVYYALTTEVQGEVIRLKADDADKKLLKHLLDQLDIPVVADDGKRALIDKLLSGEVMSDEEKAKLRGYLEEEGK